MILCFGTNMKQYGPFKHSLGGAGSTPTRPIGTVRLVKSLVAQNDKILRIDQWESEGGVNIGGN